MSCTEVGTKLGMGNPCACCGPSFGCGWQDGVYKPFPKTLSFILSIASLCPEGPENIISGTLTYQEDTIDVCDPAEVLNCDPADNASLPRRVCACFYNWDIDPGDIPACGQYVESVRFFCQPVNYRPDEEGHVQVWAGTGCAHQKLDTCVWWMSAVIKRTDRITTGIQVACDAVVDDMRTCYDKVQDPVTCGFSNGTAHTDPFPGPTSAAVLCECAACPADYCIGNCTPACLSCADTGLCCNTDCLDDYTSGDCQFLGSPITCGPACNAPDTPADCNTQARNLLWGHFSCAEDGQVRGLNPVCCPPNDDDTGDFFLEMRQHGEYDGDGFFLDFASNCEDDYVQIFCS